MDRKKRDEVDLKRRGKALREQRVDEVIAQARLRLRVLRDNYEHGLRQIRNQYLKPLASRGPEGVTAANAFQKEFSHVDPDTDPSVDHEPFDALEPAEQPAAAPTRKARKARTVKAVKAPAKARTKKPARKKAAKVTPADLDAKLDE